MPSNIALQDKAVNNSFPKIVFLFFAAMCVGLIFISIMSYKSTAAFRDTSYLVKHTQTVLDETEQISSLSKDLQLESSGYFLTGDSSFLPFYAMAKKEVLNHMNLLTHLTEDNPSQQIRISLLHQMINNLIGYSEASLQMRTSKDITPIGIYGNVIKRKEFRTKIGNTIEAIRNDEKRLLLQGEAANVKNASIAAFVFYALIAFVSILLILTFLIILYHFKKRKKAEEELRDSDTRFHLLVNNIKDYAIFMIDANGYILNWYSGAEYIKGYSDAEIIGKHISVFYAKEDIENGIPEANLKMAAKLGSYETEGWRVRKDGFKFWANVIIRAIYDSNGDLQGYTKVTRDYTLHKKAEDDIRNALEREKELSEMKSNFVSIASHEFRTPLSAILSSASLIEQYNHTEQQDKRLRHIKKIQTSVNELTAILEEFLSLEKIEQGEVRARVEPLNLKELVIKFCNEITNTAKPGQTIAYTHHGTEWIQFDPAFLRHILTNLISNAIKYSPENSLISIISQVSDGSITLQVKDKGMGIPKEAQKHLFERFFRAANAANIQGTGLGLNIVKRYVDMVQGTITVNSKEGSGSEFVIQFKNQPPIPETKQVPYNSD